MFESFFLFFFTEQFFIPVSCFLLFNMCDWAGRSLTAVWMWVSFISSIKPPHVFCLHPAHTSCSYRDLFLYCLMLCINVLTSDESNNFLSLFSAEEGQRSSSSFHCVSSHLHPSFHAVQRSASSSPAHLLPSRWLVHNLHDLLCVQ